MIDLTNLDGSKSMKQTNMPADTPAAWIKNSVYVLNEKDHQLITSPTGWLDDTIIQASQLLLAQHFPDMEGLQPPTLEQIQGFQVHSGEFLHLRNVRRSHWILVSNVGCDKGVVHVYNTMYSSVPLSQCTLLHVWFYASLLSSHSRWWMWTCKEILLTALFSVLPLLLIFYVHRLPRLQSTPTS